MSGWRSAVSAAQTDPTLTRAAVKAVLAELAGRVPGRSVELRIPPYGAVQIIPGPPHRRGTPKATVEMDAEVLFGLALGQQAWPQAVADGAVIASGERTDLAPLFPLDPQPRPATDD